MIYTYKYRTQNNFDDILMNSDGEYLTGLHFLNSKDESEKIINCEEKDLPIFRETSKWLDIYFSGREPEFTPKYKILNSTPFRQDVIDILNSIKFGETMTYKDISETIAKKRGLKTMSAQAVGGANDVDVYNSPLALFDD